MILHLARHGRTPWNSQRRLQGWKGGPLSPEGEEEARLLAERLTHISPQAVYSSDLIRAVQTAQIVIERLGWNTELVQDPRLREINHGEWEGKRVSEIPGLRDMVSVEGFRPPGGESFYDVARRVHDFLSELRARPFSEVLVVGHQVSNAVLRLLAMGFAPDHKVFGFLSSGMVSSLGLLAYTGHNLLSLIQANTDCESVELR